MENVLITGVSTGIGYAAARLLVQKNIHVFGSVRKESDASKLSKELGPLFTPLVFDVTDEAGLKKAYQLVQQKIGNKNLLGVVNNAGIAVAGPMAHISIEDFRNQLEVNVIAPVRIIQTFLPLLGTKNRTAKPGRIINISSVAGKRSLPFLGPYAASKHALEGFSESLRRELLLYGIDVIIIGPGTIQTPIWEKAGLIDVSKYTNTDYIKIMTGFRDYAVRQGKHGLPAEDVAKLIYSCLIKKNPRARYAIVPQRFKNWTLPGLLPTRLFDRLVGKKLGLLK